MRQKKAWISEEDKEELLTAGVMLLPWILLLVFGGIITFCSPKRPPKDYTKEQEAIRKAIDLTNTYQFEWPTGVIEVYDKKDIVGWKYYPETGYLEIKTKEIEKDGWGSSNVTYGVHSMTVKDGVAYIKAGYDW